MMNFGVNIEVWVKKQMILKNINHEMVNFLKGLNPPKLEGEIGFWSGLVLRAASLMLYVRAEGFTSAVSTNDKPDSLKKPTQILWLVDLWSNYSNLTRLIFPKW